MTVVHLAEGAVRLGEPGPLGRRHRGRTLAQADLDLDVRARERVAQVLRLGRPLEPTSR